MSDKRPPLPADDEDDLDPGRPAYPTVGPNGELPLPDPRFPPTPDAPYPRLPTPGHEDDGEGFDAGDEIGGIVEVSITERDALEQDAISTAELAGFVAPRPAV